MNKRGHNRNPCRAADHLDISHQRRASTNSENEVGRSIFEDSLPKCVALGVLPRIVVGQFCPGRISDNLDHGNAFMLVFHPAPFGVRIRVLVGASTTRNEDRIPARLKPLGNQSDVNFGAG
jgi:hypothetical protein